MSPSTETTMPPSTETKPTFFITGATGNQGGALTRQLLSAGYSVNALVRDRTKPTSQHLATLGATLIQGDYLDTTALGHAAKSCHGLFLNTIPTQLGETEVQHARNIIRAARDAGIRRIVYSSATRVEDCESFDEWNNGTGLRAGYLQAKRQIQDLVRTAGFESWTILQPAWIMTNWIAPVSKWFWPELAHDHALLSAFAPDTQVHLIDPEDIALFAVRALTTPDMNGHIIRLAGDSLTPGQIADEMSRVSGQEIQARYREQDEVEKLKETSPFVASQLWQRMSGTMVDLDKVKAHGVDVTGFREFLEAHREELMQAL